MKKTIVWGLVGIVVAGLVALNVVQRIERNGWVDRYAAKCEAFIALEEKYGKEKTRADDWERRMQFMHDARKKEHADMISVRRFDLDKPGEYDFDLEVPARSRQFWSQMKLKIVEHCEAAPQEIEGRKGYAKYCRWMTDKGLRLDLFTKSDKAFRHHVYLHITDMSKAERDQERR